MSWFWTAIACFAGFLCYTIMVKGIPTHPILAAIYSIHAAIGIIVVDRYLQRKADEADRSQEGGE